MAGRSSPGRHPSRSSQPGLANLRGRAQISLAMLGEFEARLCELPVGDYALGLQNEAGFSIEFFEQLDVRRQALQRIYKQRAKLSDLHNDMKQVETDLQSIKEGLESLSEATPKLEQEEAELKDLADRYQR